MISASPMDVARDRRSRESVRGRIDLINHSRYVRNNPVNAVDPSGLFDDHDHHTWVREKRIREEVEAIAKAAGLPDFEIDDFAVPGVDKDSVHFRTPAALSKQLRVQGVKNLSRGGAWNNALLAQLTDPTFKKLSPQNKMKALMTWMIDESGKYGVDLTKMHHYGRVISAADNVRSLGKFLAIAQAVGVDDKKQAKLIGRMVSVLGETADGVAALARLGFKPLSNGGKIVGYIGKLGPYTTPIVVIAALAGGATLGEAAEAGARDMVLADEIEAGHRIVVIEGGAIVSDALIDADALNKKRRLADAYREVGMEDVLVRDMLRYMQAQGVEAFRAAVQELKAFKGQGSGLGEMPPTVNTDSWLSILFGWD